MELEGLCYIGYVANRLYTVQGESMRTGRMHDRIANTATGVVKCVTP